MNCKTMSANFLDKFINSKVTAINPSKQLESSNLKIELPQSDQKITLSTQYTKLNNSKESNNKYKSQKFRKVVQNINKKLRTIPISPPKTIRLVNPQSKKILVKTYNPEVGKNFKNKVNTSYSHFSVLLN